MGKLEELEKIRKLKDSQILTEKEFEIEKYKILNADTDTNDKAFEKKEKNRKKSTKIIIAVVLIIAIVVCGVIFGKVIKESIEITQTEKKLKSIDVAELEENLIKELEKSKLNINTENLQTTFGNNETSLSKSNNNKLLVASTEFWYEMMKTENPYEKYISAYIVTRKENDYSCEEGSYGGIGVVIPLFKIVTDSEGNFQYILYSSYANSNTCSAIKDVFKSKYDIEVPGMGKYNEVFRMNGMKHHEEIVEAKNNIYEEDDINEYFIMEEIIEELGIGWYVDNLDNMPEENMAFFGID